MANDEHIKILKMGVRVWDEWRKGNSLVVPDFTRSDLKNLDLSDMNLRGSDLREADLRGVVFKSSDLSGAQLCKAELRRAVFSGANLVKANISEANLKGSNLDGADLSESILTGANLWEASIVKANLRRADLTNAVLRGANLSGSVLREANLSNADLAYANLEEANLAKTKLLDTNFYGAVFTFVNLHQAVFGNTIIANTLMQNVSGLASCIHLEMSAIDFQTLYKSTEIPSSFLKGCGLTDQVIDYLPLLLRHPLKHYSLFISYSAEDESFAQKIHSDLQEAGIRCWFAPQDMKAGDRIRTAIDEAIRVHDKLLLILSENSIRSKWVESEVETALAREVETNKQVLYTIRLDDSVLGASASWVSNLVMRRHISDFSKWKIEDAYNEAFSRLIRDISVKSAFEIGEEVI